VLLSQDVVGHKVHDVKKLVLGPIPQIVLVQVLDITGLHPVVLVQTHLLYSAGTMIIIRQVVIY
jgi:hypothetical protein